MIGLGLGISDGESNARGVGLDVGGLVATKLSAVGRGVLAKVAASDGLPVGLPLGTSDGLSLATAVGLLLGTSDGMSLAARLGISDGKSEDNRVGFIVGGLVAAKINEVGRGVLAKEADSDGLAVGLLLGISDGISLANAVGLLLGTSDGRSLIAEEGCSVVEILG